MHFAALDWRDASAFMAALRAREGMGVRALQFAILTAARSGEVRGAQWSEIDMEPAEWIIPAERMKTGQPHRVPLSEPALAILRERVLCFSAGPRRYERGKRSPNDRLLDFLEAL